MFFTISNFSKSYFLSLFDRSRFKTIFCRFPSKFSQGFWRLVLVRPFYPFFFSLISFFMHFRETFGPNNFWDLWCLRWFLSKLINGFLLLDDVNMFLMVYFDQFGELGRIGNSRAWNSTKLGILFNWD